VLSAGFLGGLNGKVINPLNAKLNPICHLLVLLGAHHILHISRIRVKTAWPTDFIFDSDKNNVAVN
jgi:hypothetical protein